MRYLLILGVAALSACNTNENKGDAQSEQHQKDSTAQLTLTDSANFSDVQWIDSVKQDIGQIKMGQVVEITWKFKNTGSKPLVIANVSPGCGCTVADRPTEPIAPGSEGKITAKFDSKGQNPGPHTKSVTVQANTKQQAYYLEFTATVVPS
jgi:hypothetical protein